MEKRLKRNATLRRTGEMKRTPLSKESLKRQAENRKRKKVVDQLRQDITTCEAQTIRECTGAPQDAHEVKTRGRGGSITDPENIILVCRPCHTWLTDNPAEADCRGLTIPGWGTEEHLSEAKRIREARQSGHKVCSSWCGIPEHQ